MPLIKSTISIVLVTAACSVVWLKSHVAELDKQAKAHPVPNLNKSYEFTGFRKIKQATHPVATFGKPSKKRGDAENPKVDPGLVKWCPDFEAACKKSKITGRPVLVFHLMGNLDERFT